MLHRRRKIGSGFFHVGQIKPPSSGMPPGFDGFDADDLFGEGATGSDAPSSADPALQVGDKLRVDGKGPIWVVEKTYGAGGYVRREDTKRKWFGYSHARDDHRILIYPVMQGSGDRTGPDIADGKPVLVAPKSAATRTMELTKSTPAQSSAPMQSLPKGTRFPFFETDTRVVAEDAEGQFWIFDSEDWAENAAPAQANQVAPGVPDLGDFRKLRGQYNQDESAWEHGLFMPRVAQVVQLPKGLSEAIQEWYAYAKQELTPKPKTRSRVNSSPESVRRTLEDVEHGGATMYITVGRRMLEVAPSTEPGHVLLDGEVTPVAEVQALAKEPRGKKDDETPGGMLSKPSIGFATWGAGSATIYLPADAFEWPYGIDAEPVKHFHVSVYGPKSKLEMAPKGNVLAYVYGSPPQLYMRVRKEVTTELKATLEHELVHVVQYWLQMQKGLKGEGGLPVPARHDDLARAPYEERLNEVYPYLSQARERYLRLENPPRPDAFLLQDPRYQKFKSSWPDAWPRVVNRFMRELSRADERVAYGAGGRALGQDEDEVVSVPTGEEDQDVVGPFAPEYADTGPTLVEHNNGRTLLHEGARAAAATELPNEAYAILDRVAGGAPGATFGTGGCWLFARAMQHVQGGELFVLASEHNPVEHVLLKTGGTYLDVDGTWSAEQLAQNYPGTRLEPLENQPMGEVPVDEGAALELAELLTQEDEAPTLDVDAELGVGLRELDRGRMDAPGSQHEQWTESYDDDAGVHLGRVAAARLTVEAVQTLVSDVDPRCKVRQEPNGAVRVYGDVESLRTIWDTSYRRWKVQPEFVSASSVDDVPMFDAPRLTYHPSLFEDRERPSKPKKEKHGPGKLRLVKGQAVGALTQADVDAWAADVQARLGLQVFELRLLRDGSLKLDTIIVPKGERRQGAGTAAVQALNDYADEHGLRVVLSPAVRDDHHGTTSRGRLVKFYKERGYTENKGRKKDFTFSESMYRDPTQKKGQAEHETRPPWVAVDLDGTLLSYEAGMAGRGELGEPIEGAREAMRELAALGWRVSVYTARFQDLGDEETDALREQIEEHLTRAGIPFGDVWVGRKPQANFFVDDRALTFEGDWANTLQTLVGFGASTGGHDDGDSVHDDTEDRESGVTVQAVPGLIDTVDSGNDFGTDGMESRRDRSVRRAPEREGLSS